MNYDINKENSAASAGGGGGGRDSRVVSLCVEGWVAPALRFNTHFRDAPHRKRGREKLDWERKGEREYPGQHEIGGGGGGLEYVIN